jgi:hypothetical protein
MTARAEHAATCPRGVLCPTLCHAALAGGRGGRHAGHDRAPVRQIIVAKHCVGAHSSPLFRTHDRFPIAGLVSLSQTHSSRPRALIRSMVTVDVIPWWWQMTSGYAEASGAAGGGTSASAEDNGEAFAGQPSVTELLAIRRTAHRRGSDSSYSLQPEAQRTQL